MFWIYSQFLMLNFKTLQGQQGGGGGGKVILKTAKGTRDYNPAQMAVREKVGSSFILKLTIFFISLSINIFIPLLKLSKFKTDKRVKP